MSVNCKIKSGMIRLKCSKCLLDELHVSFSAEAKKSSYPQKLDHYNFQLLSDYTQPSESGRW